MKSAYTTKEMILASRGVRIASIMLVLLTFMIFIWSVSRSPSEPKEEVSTTQNNRVDSDKCFEEEEKEEMTYQLKERLFFGDKSISMGEPPPVPVPYTVNTTISNVLMSTCSAEATSRGPHQKVIAFIFYGKVNCSRNYFEGIEENIKLAQKLYPGWIIRVYYELYDPVEYGYKLLMDLKARYKSLDLCNGNDLPGFGNLEGTQRRIWRFLPLVDPLVDIFLSRDLDCRLSERELAAVNEWLDSGLTFHVMRDSVFQSYPILAGMWGARVHQARELLFSLTMKMFVKGRVGQKNSFDQFVLASVVWPVIKGHVMQHDSYYCEEEFAEQGNMRSFPTKRMENTTKNYIGANVMEDFIMDYPCPVACRPPEHPDWITC